MRQILDDTGGQVRNVWWSSVSGCVRRWYIIRASFSQERMNYYRECGQEEYRSKDGKETKVIDALEWPRQRAAGCPASGMQAQALAAMCSHVPNKGEQMARYYGFYSNVARGKRKKTDADDKIPCFLEPVESLPSRASGSNDRNWPARFPGEIGRD